MRPTGLQPGTPWLYQLEAAITTRSTAFALYLTEPAPSTEFAWESAPR